jgi:hypothetical protein
MAVGACPSKERYGGNGAVRRGAHGKLRRVEAWLGEARHGLAFEAWDSRARCGMAGLGGTRRGVHGKLGRVEARHGMAFEAWDGQAWDGRSRMGAARHGARG